MKSIKIILISAEIATLIGIVCLAFTETTHVENWIKATYISMFALLAVGLQREQQAIKWNSEKEEYDEDDERIEMFISSEMDKGR